MSQSRRLHWLLVSLMIFCGCSRRETIVMDPDGNPHQVVVPWTMQLLELLLPVLMLVLVASGWLHWKRTRDLGLLLLALGGSLGLFCAGIGMFCATFAPSQFSNALQFQQTGSVVALLLALCGGLRTLWTGIQTSSTDNPIRVAEDSENPYESPRS